MTTYSNPSCQSTITEEIVVHETCHWPNAAAIPDVFTPNNDQINDYFQVPNAGLTNITVQIYNRWGNQIYEFNGENGSWNGLSKDGAPAPEGTYFYLAQMTCPLTNVTKKFEGFLQLSR